MEQAGAEPAVRPADATGGEAAGAEAAGGSETVAGEDPLGVAKVAPVTELADLIGGVGVAQSGTGPGAVAQEKSPAADPVGGDLMDAASPPPARLLQPVPAAAAAVALTADDLALAILEEDQDEQLPSSPMDVSDEPGASGSEARTMIL